MALSPSFSTIIRHNTATLVKVLKSRDRQKRLFWGENFYSYFARNVVYWVRFWKAKIKVKFMHLIEWKHLIVWTDEGWPRAAGAGTCTLRWSPQEVDFWPQEVDDGLLDGAPPPQNPVPKIGVGFTGTADWVDQLCGWTLNLGDDRLGPGQLTAVLQVKPHPSHGRQKTLTAPQLSLKCSLATATVSCDGYFGKKLGSRQNLAQIGAFSCRAVTGAVTSNRRSIPSFISPQQRAQAMVGLLGQPGVVICI